MSNNSSLNYIDHLYPSGLDEGCRLRSPTQIHLKTVTVLAEAVPGVDPSWPDDHVLGLQKGDAKGTAASHWLRGLEYFQWPTELTISEAIQVFVHLLQPIDPHGYQICLRGELDLGSKQSQIAISAAMTPSRGINFDVAAPAATGSLVAARIRKERPGPKPEDHLKFYRLILETVGSSGKSSDGEPEILLDDNNLRKIVAAADSKGIKPPGRRRSEFITKPPYPSWAVCLTDNKEACRKAIQNRIKWATRGF